MRQVKNILYMVAMSALSQPSRESQTCGAACGGGGATPSSLPLCKEWMQSYNAKMHAYGKSQKNLEFIRSFYSTSQS